MMYQKNHRLSHIVSPRLPFQKLYRRNCNDIKNKILTFFVTRSTHFFGEFSHKGGIPKIIQVPLSTLLGAETIRGNCVAFLVLDIEAYAFNIN